MQGIKGEYKGLQGITGEYKGLTDCSVNTSKPRSEISL